VGKSKNSSPPPPPDPVATAQAQGAANQDAIRLAGRLNRVNEYGPMGSVTYSGNDDTGYNRVTEYSGLAKALNDEVFNRIAGGALRPNINIPSLRAPSDFSADRSRVEKAMFDRIQGLIKPTFDERRGTLEQRLADQGQAMGNEGYNREMNRFDTELSEANERAALDAITGAGSEQSRLMSLDLGTQQALRSAAEADRSRPFNELASLMSGISMPQGAPAWQAPVVPTDTITPTLAAYQGQVNAYNADQNRQAQGKGALASMAGTLGGAALLASGNPAGAAAASSGSNLLRKGR